MRLDVLVVLIGEGTAAIYACMCLAALRGRRSGASAHAPYRMPGFPLIPICWRWPALAAVGTADLFDPDGREGLLASAVVIAASVLYYPSRPASPWGMGAPGTGHGPRSRLAGFGGGGGPWSSTACPAAASA